MTMGELRDERDDTSPGARESAERPALHESLREAEERFRLAFDQAPIGMAIVDLDGRFARVNQALCVLVGYSSDELTGLTFQAITHPADLGVDLELAGRLRRGELLKYELAKRYVHKDGSTVDVVLTGSVVRDPHGQPLYYIAHVQDVTAQKRDEEARQRSELRARELLEHAPEGVFVADLSGRYTSVNAAACRLLGYTRDELLSKTIEDLLRPEDVPRLRADREALLAPGTVRVGEWVLRRKDGSHVPVVVSTTILADGRWQAFVKDISERKRAEAALRRSEESLALAQRAAHVGSFDWDVRNNVAYRSAELCALFGFPPEAGDSPPWTLAEAYHPDDRELVFRTLREAEHEGRSYRLEHRLLRRDGTERVVLHQGDVVIEEGRVVRIVGTMLDVTERKRAEREREETFLHLRAVLDQCPVGIILVRGARGEHVELNAHAQRLVGRTIEHVGQYPDMLLATDGGVLPLEERPVPRALRGEHFERVDLLLRQASGATLPVSVGAAPVVDARGVVQGAVVVFQDVTPLKELERLRAEWSSIVAHDLRQPLNGIALSARFIARALARASVPPPAGVVSSLDIVERAASRLNRMVDDLLDLSRLEARRLVLLRRPTDVVALVKASVEPIALQAVDRTFDVRVEGAVPVVEVDPDRVAQVVENLLTNAVKYGAPETPVVVTVGAPKEHVVVAVTNEGAGIAPEDLPRLFHRFARAEDAERAAVKGVGLGLHIARELVRAHGGEITVESVPGAATTFRFTLPLACATA